MRAMLLIAHGSRRESSNAETLARAEALRQRAEPDFAAVRCAFAEMAEPTIAAAADALAAAGASEVVVVPLFLAAGHHVLSDLPKQLLAVADRHPGVRFEIAPHLGSFPELNELILDHARATAGRFSRP